MGSLNAESEGEPSLAFVVQRKLNPIGRGVSQDCDAGLLVSFG